MGKNIGGFKTGDLVVIQGSGPFIQSIKNDSGYNIFKVSVVSDVYLSIACPYSEGPLDGIAVFPNEIRHLNKIEKVLFY